MEEENKYPRVTALFDHYEINHNDDDWREEIIEKIAWAAIRDITHKQNVGINVSRLEHNLREKAFHDEWLKENAPNRGINHGHGILQDLFIESDGFLKGKRMVEEITKRDRQIVATIIQWLGSNCGMSFLEISLKNCGYKITPIKNEKT